jgi:nicotinate phosphoribosyltransferase
VTGEPSALLTDLYQLTMLHAYVRWGMEDTAVFELFVRRLPPERGFLVAAGLEQAVEFLETLRFTPDDLAWVAANERFDAAFARYLEGLRFTGDVDALPEGTPCFADEPLLRIVAPLPQAQLVETRLINLLHFQTLVASKAARCVLAARGTQLVDFGLRRAHGAEAGLLAARAAYLAGFAGTATVAAGVRFGIPLHGTIAHSFVEAHDDEAEAFRHLAAAAPSDTVLLLDTYDTEIAARRVVALARDGVAIKGVRLDSGDLGRHARNVRRLLDEAGLADVLIFASGNLDEQRIRQLLEAGAPIDGFGVGTQLASSADAPALDCVYKLQEYAGRPRRKRAEGKATWPGRKQVFRRYGPDGVMVGDVVTLAGETAEGEPLLRPVMRAGRRVARLPALAETRRRTAAALARLPGALRTLDPEASYPVAIAPALRALAAAIDARPVV